MTFPALPLNYRYICRRCLLSICLTTPRIALLLCSSTQVPPPFFSLFQSPYFPLIKNAFPLSLSFILCVRVSSHTKVVQGPAVDRAFSSFGFPSLIEKVFFLTVVIEFVFCSVRYHHAFLFLMFVYMQRDKGERKEKKQTRHPDEM